MFIGEVTRLARFIHNAMRSSKRLEPRRHLTVVVAVVACYLLA